MRSMISPLNRWRAIVRPQRIRLSHVKGFNLQRVSRELNGLPAINCARPSFYGNPFRIGGWYRRGDSDPTYQGPFGLSWSEALEADRYPHRQNGYTKITSHEEAVEWFRWLESIRSIDHLARLRGHNLACRCHLDQPCHVDVYLERLA